MFVPNYRSKFSPAKVLDGTRIDFWVTNLEVKACSDISDFYWGLHGHGYKKGGGTLFTTDGAFNSAGCMDSLFPVRRLRVFCAALKPPVLYHPRPPLMPSVCPPRIAPCHL